MKKAIILVILLIVAISSLAVENTASAETEVTNNYISFNFEKLGELYFCRSLTDKTGFTLFKDVSLIFNIQVKFIDKDYVLTAPVTFTGKKVMLVGGTDWVYKVSISNISLNLTDVQYSLLSTSNGKCSLFIRVNGESEFIKSGGILGYTEFDLDYDISTTRPIDTVDNQDVDGWAESTDTTPTEKTISQKIADFLHIDYATMDLFITIINWILLVIVGCIALFVFSLIIKLVAKAIRNFVEVFW